jgi:hypothetical protein
VNSDDDDDDDDDDNNDDNDYVMTSTVTRAHTWHTLTVERKVCNAAPTLEPNFQAPCPHILAASTTPRKFFSNATTCPLWTSWSPLPVLTEV